MDTVIDMISENLTADKVMLRVVVIDAVETVIVTH